MKALRTQIMKVLRIILATIIVVAIFATLLYSIRLASVKRDVPPVEVLKTVVDTVWFERPQPMATAVKTATVKLPHMVFVERTAYDSLAYHGKNSTSDANYSTPRVDSLCLQDSITMTIDIESCIYEDSLYRAQVSGPVIGDLHPALDWVEVYNRTTVQTITRRKRFAITAGVGAACTPKGFQPTVGVQVGVILWSF